jgi:hypothetical protein
MTANDKDPWTTRAMEEFGDQLLALEDRVPARSRRRRMRIAIAAAVPAAAVVAGVVLITGAGHPPTKAPRPSSPPAVSAGAMQPTYAASAVNRAAAAATSSGSALYHATTTITVHGRPVSKLSSTGALSFKHRGYQATISNAIGNVTTERIFADGTLYARTGATGRTQPRWIAVPSPTKDLSSSALLPGSEALTDPPAVLQAMSTAAGQPVVVATAPIDGVKTTAYRVITQLAKFIPNIPLSGAVGREPVGLTVWVDRAGRPRRVIATFANPSADATLATQTHFYGYGTTARVRPPAADDVRRVAASTGLPDPLAADLANLFLAAAPANTSRPAG